MRFLGIRDGHDCNISYSDGNKVRYIKFERNLQKKHYNWMHEDGDHMADLIKRATEIWGVDLSTVDAIAIASDNGLHKLDRDIQPNELHFKIEKGSHPLWDQFSCPVHRLDHHYAHTLSVWPLVKIDDVHAHFVVDGLGDLGKHSAVITGNNPADAALIDFVDRSMNPGLSIMLENIGDQYGMKGMRLDLSGKVMALKSYHSVPEQFEEHIMRLSSYLNYRHLRNFTDIASQVLPRINGVDEKQNLVNMAYMLHVFGEHKIPEYISTFAADDAVITYSGGTAQNTVINTHVKRRFKNSHIPPHCPDDGLSLGCVEFLRQVFQQDYFDNSNFPYWQSDEAPDSVPSDSTIDEVADMLAGGKIIGWYQGNGEVGPRALGNRSILMDPSIKDGKDTINRKVKKREPYRPFGASVLAEKAGRHFDCDFETPYMLHVVDCLGDDFSSIMHVDKTCRIQTVNQEPQYATYRRLLERFDELTGIPMLLNTSLNVDGKPIAAYKDDAVKLFEDSELDAVVIGNEVLVK